MTDPERFWDDRAKENALFFVDNNVAYADPDIEGFWAGGEEAFEGFVKALGLTVQAGDVVVDIGCGVGRMTRVLARRARRVLALDVSTEMLHRAQELNTHLDNVEWLHGDGRSLAPIASGSVDGCFSHVVFQHIPDPEVTLGYVREMGRVLRPGGWAAFVVSTDPRIHRPGVRTRVRRALARARGGSSRPGDDPSWLGSSVRAADLERAAAQAQMPVERMAGAGTQYTAVLCRRGG